MRGVRREQRIERDPPASRCLPLASNASAWWSWSMIAGGEFSAVAADADAVAGVATVPGARAAFPSLAVSMARSAGSHPLQSTSSAVEHPLCGAVRISVCR